MTIEQCRAAQRECAQRIFAAIEQLRRETKEDISAIREAVQSIDRAVAAVKGYLGLNGNSSPDHLHRRDSEGMEHLHQRITDLLEAQEKTPPQDWRVKVMWGLGIFAAGAIGTPILGALGHAIAERLTK